MYNQINNKVVNNQQKTNFNKNTKMNKQKKKSIFKIKNNKQNKSNKTKQREISMKKILNRIICKFQICKTIKKKIVNQRQMQMI